MTSIGILVSIVTIFLSARQYYITKDKQLETPYQSFQNTYLQFQVVPSAVDDSLETNRNSFPLSISLRHLKENDIEVFDGLFTANYDLDFDEKWIDLYYDKKNFIPENIKKYPTEYFYKSCVYRVPLPAGQFTLLAKGHSKFEKKILGKGFGFNISLEPNETILAWLVYDRNSNLGNMQIRKIPTPSDINEIKKCNSIINIKTE